MRLALAVLVSAGIIIAACSGDGEEAPPSISGLQSASHSPVAGSLTVTFDGDDGPVELLVELADTPNERSQGLRNRQSMEENRGMLFAWPGDVQSAFGMPETYIPLTIAFIREDGSIAHTEDMEPLSTTPYRSPEAYRYAIEANQGWFADNGIETGDFADIPEDAGAAAQ